MSAPEYNVTGLDYGPRGHLRADEPPLIDVHAHVVSTKPPDAPEGTPGDLAQAETMLAVAHEFGVARIYSMCPVEDIAPLRERFGRMLGFNGSIARKADEPDDAPARMLERFLEQVVEIIKFWAATPCLEPGRLRQRPRLTAAARLPPAA